MTTGRFLLLLVVAVFVGGRHFVPVVPLDLGFTSLYKDAAHVLFGCVFGAWVVTRDRLLFWMWFALGAAELTAVFTR